MMKKKVLLIVCLILVIGGGSIATVAAVSNKTNEPKYGYYEYQGKKYPVSTKKQDEIIKKYEANEMELYQKEILIALGIVEDVKVPLGKIGEALSKLDKNTSSDMAIVNCINTVAGTYDIEGGSGLSYYIYNLEDGYSLTVELGGCRVFKDGEYVKTIFASGLGYNEIGWTKEEMEKALH